MSKKTSRSVYESRRRFLKSLGISTRGFGSARTRANKAKLTRLFHQTLESSRFQKIPRSKLDNITGLPEAKGFVYVEKKGYRYRAVRGKLVREKETALSDGSTFVQMEVIVVPAGEALFLRIEQSRELQAITNCARSWSKYVRHKKGGKLVFGVLNTRTGGISDQVPIPMDTDKNAVDATLAAIDAMIDKYGEWIAENLSIGISYIK